ncbi:MAG: aldehyde-activating protein [Gammaproteobacteria bacterium CG11_big_fil_rev_8_21_14_0_20_46_22]|nr:MAG: aldehyde-activating protein [Gammaproteobacteria bacterium CG12_big_fil_rev_8_21_14_0_65_46_12]PIR11466.1 MAG: aldehyde-activating protein [Gammaproteobacteria bacterium CG11_big_fil_rev_8_21_14_0_20_46_22]
MSKARYTGTCHCKKVRFVCELELKQPMVCNCSYCAIRNVVHHVADNLRITSGEGDLSCYRFNTMKGEHYFCRHCGVYIYLIPSEPLFPCCVNLCALDDCDWRSLPLKVFDGKAI